MTSVFSLLAQSASAIAGAGEAANNAAAGAAQQAAAAAPADSGNVVVQYLNDGGWGMYVILAASIVGLVVFLERAFDLMIQRKLNARAFMQQVLAHVEAKRFREALTMCDVRSKHPLVRVIRAGLLRANLREKDIERAMEDEMLNALPQLQKRVQFVALLANTATLLGLLGTIFGLISAFASVAAASAAERQEALAGGISQAMYTTAFGIAVAVPLLFFHHIINQRSETMIMEIEGGATSLMVALAGIMPGVKPDAGA